MSYIINISKDAYKQNNTYYLRKGNTMKKSFVMAAVAATIAASSAMATTITPTGVSNKVDWTGSIGANDLADVCNFIDNDSGAMTFDGGVWTSDNTDTAFVELKQRGAHKIMVEPDHYVREVDSNGNILNGGVAHAVNVDYTPNTSDGVIGIGSSDSSQATAYIQDANNPQQVGNVAVLLSDAVDLGARVLSEAGSNVKDNGTISNTGQLLDSKKGKFYIQGDTLTDMSGTTALAIPFGHLKLTIGGTATLIDGADEALLKNGSRYAITHTVTCLK